MACSAVRPVASLLCCVRKRHPRVMLEERAHRKRGVESEQVLLCRFTRIVALVPTSQAASTTG